MIEFDTGDWARKVGSKWKSRMRLGRVTAFESAARPEKLFKLGGRCSPGLSVPLPRSRA